MQRLSLLAAAALLGLAGTTAQAADWSDTSIGVRYGTHFAEPFDNQPDGSRTNIKKTIISLTHVSGYKYGTNFFNVDLLNSDHNDPAAGSGTGAREAYIVYRNFLDIGKVSGKDFKMGPVRGFGVTGGFDWNTKNDSYSSKKQMLVFGPTVEFDVPGFANLSLLGFRESNAPTGVARYYYKTHAALELDWGLALPIPAVPLSFNGYALWIGSKGTNEFGGGTAPETHIDMSLMYDVGMAMGMGKKVALIGLEYEYWRNKFGNPSTNNKGATASTPMIRAEYHF